MPLPSLSSLFLVFSTFYLISVGSVGIPAMFGSVTDEGIIFVYEAFPKPLGIAEEQVLSD
jgi:hypothetical protein